MQKNQALLLLCVMLLCGCESKGPRYTGDDYQAASSLCYSRAYADQAAKVPDWYTRWLVCRQERVMPIELYVHSRKEAEVRKVYEKMFELAPLVDSGVMSAQDAYAQIDKMNDELLDKRCALIVQQADGGSRCLNFRSTKK